MVADDSKRKMEIKQQGIYEYLLCRECEQLLSPLETYANDILFRHMDAAPHEVGRIWKFYDIDYKKFKLFEMSLLWRAGVSNHKMFSAVKLGPHEEIIRNMLLSLNPGRYYEYGSALI